MTITNYRAARSRPLRQVTELARTTPGVLGALALLLVVVGVTAGVFTAVSVQRRAQALEDLATRSGPLSVAAQEIYRSLSDADATASGAFLAGGLEPPAVRARFEQDIAQASNALAIAVAAREPADVTAPHSPLTTLSGQLPVYTGLVETARVNNRQGLPLGIAYQREASNLMRTQLLPAAQQLYDDEIGRVSADQNRAGGFPFAELLLGLAVLAVLVVAQIYVRRRTNRVFNVGLVAATVAAVISLVWVSVAAFSVISSVDDSRIDGSIQVDVLARARIATLQARGDETLTLVARGTGKVYEDDFDQVTRSLSGLLNEAVGKATDGAVSAKVTSARSTTDEWLRAHDELRKQDDGGNYAAAVRLAIAAVPEGTAAAFDKLDTDLRGAIDLTRAAFNARIRDANDALGGTVVVVSLLALVVAAGATAGLWQRLKEYR
ncbi:hypothetical protein [Kibdelosporangium phytohabitans]|uniref:Secreted protein n=1 Tax=Kibdelosporangium phytohabitans TaxID=860235 RepID=A0A0N7F386_9PSEU|nr:hypothetical protein [Kibdelosporangium phytohabitans]ALG07935.1 hypothetical protein AOZ06_14320 [Kibdelosporangium phytohabitans]MBE1471125.1 hypothetical protein [Kibdelosporangium phytohabitans]